MLNSRLLLLLLPLSAVALAARPVSFNEDIRPILADNCFSCHGTDTAHRKGDRRLDTPEGATAAIDGVRALVPGDLSQSELWQRIISRYDDEVMPPPESHKQPLSPEQQNLIRRWIEQGGVYQRHWAFEPMAVPAVPDEPLAAAPKARRAGSHPIDRFIGHKLAGAGLAFASEASREVLIRRVTLDLTGLPPTLAEIDAFLGDRSPQAYERVVDRLLASPRYGEHAGRFWLDAVRYADTHGMHLDNARNIWPYRDWVVGAFNRNLPFDRFTVEQLAGDLLPNPSVDQLVATGYHRNQITTAEAGAIEAEAEMRTTADRVDTTAAVWLGLTANCASCHDHKFDPLSQREYYSMGAIFKGLADRVWDGNVQVSGPVAVIGRDAAEQRRIDVLVEAIKPLEAAVTARADVLVAGELAPPKYERVPITYEVIWAEDSDLPVPAAFMPPPTAGEWKQGPDVPVAGGHRALRLEGTAVRPFAFTAGDVNLLVRTEARAFVHVRLDPENLPRAISLEFMSEEKTRRAIWGDVNAFGPEVADNALHQGPLPAAGAYVRLELTACDSGVDEGKAYTGLRIAQSGGAAWYDRVGAICTTPQASEDPLLTKEAWIRQMENGARSIKGVPLRHDVNFLAGLSRTQQTKEELAWMGTWHRNYLYAPLRAALEPEVHAARRLLAEQVNFEMTRPVSPIARELPEPRPAHILVRGQYDKPGDRVTAAVPAFLPSVDNGGRPVTRLEFARWLVRPDHPLTARVTVNRFWAQLFGAGLVTTPGDFGTQGALPSHPELLDWLATDFIRTGWDVKRLVRLLVTSRAYRQDSSVSPSLLELDPANRLIARGSRPRLDAEVLRDQVLALGGLLRTEIGGPPVRPYQPVNIWEPVAFGGSNTKTYVQDKGDALYRRTLYTMVKRTAPAPALSTFDAPARETFCVGRNRSNTPLQALALMNDVQHVEAARAFAERVLGQPGTDQERLDRAFRLVTARTPVAAERKLLQESLQTHRARFTQAPEEAKRVLTNGESKPREDLPPVEVAAWTLVANLLFNLDETLSRN
jgi:hypothetical protein